MIKSDNIKYVHTKIKKDLLTEVTIVVIPTGKVEGDKAEFLQIHGDPYVGKLWLRREDIF